MKSSRLGMLLLFVLLLGRISAFGSAPALNLPAMPIGVTVQTVSAAAYYNVYLTNVLAGYDITNGVYAGWCVASSDSIIDNMLYQPKVASSYATNLPADLKSVGWSNINYIINHRQQYYAQGADWVDVQLAIWYFLDKASPLDTSLSKIIATNAMLNGVNFVPAPGQKIGVLLDFDNANGTPLAQNLLIEVPVPPVATLPASVSGYVYVDNNVSGVKDSADAPLNGVIMTLTGTNYLGAVVQMVTTTTNDGFYNFSVLPGTYSISEGATPGYLSYSNNVGSLGGNVSGDVITNVVLVSASAGTNYNFGEITPPTITVNPQDQQLCGGASVSFSVAATGHGTLTYQWRKDGVALTNGAEFSSVTTSTLVINPALPGDSGSYDVVVADNFGTVGSSAAVLTVFPVPTVTLSKTDVTIRGNSDGTITALVDGATPVTISLDGGAFVTANPSQTFTGLAAGHHTVTVSSSHNCMASASIDLSQPAIPVLTVTVVPQDSPCKGSASGSLTLTAGGGVSPYAYSINGVDFVPSSTFNNVEAGSYTVFVKDATGTTVSTQTGVGEPTSAVAISAITTSDVLCKGSTTGSLTVNASGGVGSLSYSIDNGSNFSTNSIFTNLVATNYIILVKDQHNCQVFTNATLVEPSSLVAISAISKTDAPCKGSAAGSITISAAGGSGFLSYSIDNAVTFSTNSVFSNLLAATYNVVVKDTNGCLAASSAVVNEPANALSIVSITKTDVTCKGAATGSLLVVATGGTGDINYSIDNGVTFTDKPEFDLLPAGNYTIIATDDNHCVASGTARIVEPATSVALVAKVSDALCKASSNGSLILTASGGTGNYTFSINGSDFAAANTFSNLSAGSYTLQAKDANGCTALTQAVVGEPASAVSVNSVTATDVLCKGSATGSLTVSAAGGVGALVYSIDNGITFSHNAFFTNLVATNYTVLVKDVNGCVDSASATIDEPDSAVTISDVSKTNVLCKGSATGIIAITAFGGSGYLSYSIDNGTTFTTNSVFSNLLAATYSVVAKDTNGCLVADSVTINEPASAVTIVSSTNTDVLCKGSATGSLTVSAIGGTGALHYSIDNGASYSSATTFSGLTAGTYNVVVVDDNGCLASKSVVINEPAQSVALALNVNNAGCNGNDGAITATFSGGTGSYVISTNGTAFASAVSPFTFTGLGAGAYTVMVMDANGCSAAQAANINVVCGLTLQCSSSSAQVGTYYSSSLIPNGGQPPYTFTISAGALPAGLTLNADGSITGTPTVPGPFSFTGKVTDATNGVAFSSCTQGCSSVGTWDFSTPSGLLGTVQSYSVNGVVVTASGFNLNGTAAALYGVKLGGNQNGLGISGGLNNEITTNSYVQLNLTQLIGSGIQNPAFAISGLQAGDKFSIYGSTNNTLGTLLVTNSTLSNTFFQVPGYPAYKYINIKASSGGILVSAINAVIPGSCSITVAPAPLALSCLGNNGAKSGAYYSSSMPVSGGTPGYTFAIVSGSLPSGLTLNPTNGLVSGTTYTWGNFPFTVKVTDSTAGTALSTNATCYVNVVITPLTLSCISASTGQVGVVYSSTMAASGGTAPYTYAILGSLPTGLTLNATNGRVSGMPTQAGMFSFVEKVTDSTTGSPLISTNYCGILISPAPMTVGCVAASSGQVGRAYSSYFPVTGGTAPYKYAITAGKLPSGLSLNVTNGVVSGTPTNAGLVSFTVTVTDATLGKALVVSASCCVTITPANLSLVCTSTNAQVGIAYTSTLAVTGGVAPYTYSIAAGALPAGLTLNANGTITGTPTAVGPYSFTVQVKDATGATALSVCSSCKTILLWDFSSPTGKLSTVQNYLYNGVTITAAGYTNASTPAALYGKKSGSTESGLGISGTSDNEITTKTWVQFDLSQLITAGAQSPLLMLNSLQCKEGYNIYGSSTAGTLGTLLVTNGTLGNVNIALPGYPNYRYLSVKAVGGNVLVSLISATVPASACTITVAPAPLDLDCVGQGSGQVGVPYSSALGVSGGTPSYAFSIISGCLPGGLSLTATNGLISGTPSKPGTFNFTFKVVDSTAPTAYVATNSCSITITVKPVVITVPTNVIIGCQSTLQACSYTQGGWGASPNGNNPGTILVNNFTTIYSKGYVTIGNNNGCGNYLKFTSAAAINAFLPAGGTAGALSCSSVNPTTSSAGVFAGQVLALQLNVDFSAGGTFGNLVLKDSSSGLNGKTIRQILSVANSVLGGGSLPCGMSLCDLNTLVANLNAAFDNCTISSWATTHLSATSSCTVWSDPINTGTATAAGGYGSITITYSDSVVTNTYGNTIITRTWVASDCSGSRVTGIQTLTRQACSVTLGCVANSGQVGTFYSSGLVTTGGQSAYTYSLISGSLPGGLSLGSCNGLISGTPTTPGTYTFTVKVKDSTYGGALVGTNTCLIKITSAPLTLGCVSTTLGQLNVAFSSSLTASGGFGKYSYSITSGSLPTGLSLSSCTGVISGTPTKDGTFTFTAQVTDSTCGSAQTTTVVCAITIVGLPCPWKTSDIGCVGATGCGIFSNSTAIVTGSGADIWDCSDAFRYVYQASSSDCSIISRIAGVQNTDGWAKAGVSIRETLCAGSVHASLFVTPANGLAFQWRSCTGSGSSNVSVTGLTAPYWLKLKRVGNGFSAWYSVNGSTWTQIGSTQTISMSSCATIGLSVTSHHDGTLCTGTFDNITATP